MNALARRHGPTIIGCLLVVGLTLTAMAMPGQASPRSEEAIDLQAIIDAAQPGSELILDAAAYSGPAIVDKPLTLRGEGTPTVFGGEADTALTIRAPGVKLSGLKVVSAKGTAIAVEADDAVIEGTTIEASGLGIALRDADRAAIVGNAVYPVDSGRAASGAAARTGNGIDLYDSHDARIEGNEVHGMMDGVYLERSHRAVVESNRIYRSRYGIHCMYTDGTTIVGNEGEYNVTGAMVMGVRDAVVTGNSFRKQSGNVHSQGLLLFDVHTSRVERNTFEGNRVGIYMELSSNNRLESNEVLRNFVGVQFLESADNVFTGNLFLSNVIEAQATDSEGNRLEGNYWDAAQLLDKDGDGASDLKYAINPFFEKAVDRTPAYQLFFQSPGMTFLSGLFTSDAAEWSSDAAPLMRPPGSLEAVPQMREEDGRDGIVGWIGISLVLGAAGIIYMGVRKI
ncbi:right-handed parallel beta-helix repeat-containing protein [Cohnella hongkongensis]|uniref:Nitrous oxide reductase family maturation protein NosD n=1 Tax=Cohnella hongkongensis TaxID=178337 RepID=A0ABV9FM65_9BACL